MMRLLGHDVEGECKNDMKTFVSSGFVPITQGVRTPSQPVSMPRIVAIDQGSSGQLVVRIQPVAKARSYDVRYAASRCWCCCGLDNHHTSQHEAAAVY